MQLALSQREVHHRQLIQVTSPAATLDHLRARFSDATDFHMDPHRRRTPAEQCKQLHRSRHSSVLACLANSIV
jgi:hypothetical protein